MIITAANNKCMVDIYDLRPLVLKGSAVIEWLMKTIESAGKIAKEAALPESDFRWQPVSNKVLSPKNQCEELNMQSESSAI